jgi:hypothetical protein
MLATQLRNRKAKGDDAPTNVTEERTGIVSEEKISKVGLLTDVIKVDENENWALSLMICSKRKDYLHTFFHIPYSTEFCIISCKLKLIFSSKLKLIFSIFTLHYFYSIHVIIFSGLFHSQIVLPFWNHLDVRGFGTLQPFICWLVIPFTLSMIVWYVAVMQLLEMGNLLEDLGPEPIYPVLEEFVWGQEL